MTIPQFIQTFVREAREAVRRNDRDRALELLRQLVTMIATAEQRAVKELQPALQALDQVGETLGAIAGAADAIGRLGRGRGRR